MIKNFIFLLFFANSFLFSFSFKQDEQKEETIQEIIDNGVSFVNEGNYDLALEEFDTLEKEIPNHPVSYFFKSATLLWIMIHYRKYNLEGEFLKWNELGLEKAKDFIKKNNEDPWGFFYSAGLLGFRGIYFYESGSFFKAFFDGIKGVNQLKKVEKIDSNITDVGYGLGLYNFWRGYFLYKILRDREGKENKKKGIEQLISTSKQGKYTQGEARKALIRIYYEEEKYDELLEVAAEELNLYPDCLYCQRYIAATYFKQSRFEASIAELEKIRNRIVRSPYDNYFSQVELDILMAKNLFAMGEELNAKRVANQIETNLKEVTELDNAHGLKVFKENLKFITKEFKTLKKKLN